MATSIDGAVLVLPAQLLGPLMKDLWGGLFALAYRGQAILPRHNRSWCRQLAEVAELRTHTLAIEAHIALELHHRDYNVTSRCSQ